jgi:hypothetical protein
MGNVMAESNGSIESLLTELVELQKAANAQQLRAIEQTEKYQAETRERVEASIRLQQVAVERQQTLVRMAMPVIFVVVVIIVILMVRMFH